MGLRLCRKKGKKKKAEIGAKKNDHFFQTKKNGRAPKKTIGACWVHDGCNKKNPEKGPSTHKTAKIFAHWKSMGAFFFKTKKWAENGRMVGAQKNARFFEWTLSAKKKEGQQPFFFFGRPSSYIA